MKQFVEHFRHWKPAQADALASIPQLASKGNFWATVEAPQIDIASLTKLFEQRTKEAPLKKAAGESKPQVLQVSRRRAAACTQGESLAALGAFGQTLASDKHRLNKIAACEHDSAGDTQIRYDGAQ